MEGQSYDTVARYQPDSSLDIYYEQLRSAQLEQEEKELRLQREIAGQKAINTELYEEYKEKKAKQEELRAKKKLLGVQYNDLKVKRDEYEELVKKRRDDVEKLASSLSDLNKLVEDKVAANENEIHIHQAEKGDLDDRLTRVYDNMRSLHNIEQYPAFSFASGSL